MTNSPAVKTNARMTVVDALRGFALAGIVIVHMAEHYAGAPIPQDAVERMMPGLADQITSAFIQIFLRGKFFALFSFLFGLSFFIQMDKAEQRGQHFGTRFLWRLILLLAIGWIHHLFYRGDILTIYAMIGLVLIPFYRARNGVLLFLSALIFLGAARFIVFGITHSTSIFFDDLMDLESPVVTAYYETLKSGSLMDVFTSNAWSGQLMKADFQIGVFGRGYLTFAFFLLGLWCGRIRFFRDFRDRIEETGYLMWASLGLFLLGIVLTGLFFAQLGPEPKMDTWTAMFGLTGYDLGNLGMTGLILGGFLILYRKSRPHRFLAAFAPYGRMALTNYVMQSLIGTFIFYGWGLGMISDVPISLSALSAVPLIALQMLFSRWWLRSFHYGPLEWVWRSLTFGQMIPFRRTEVTPV